MMKIKGFFQVLISLTRDRSSDSAVWKFWPCAILFCGTFWFISCTTSFCCHDQPTDVIKKNVNRNPLNLSQKSEPFHHPPPSPPPPSSLLWMRRNGWKLSVFCSYCTAFLGCSSSWSQDSFRQRIVNFFYTKMLLKCLCSLHIDCFSKVLNVLSYSLK